MSRLLRDSSTHSSIAGQAVRGWWPIIILSACRLHIDPTWKGNAKAKAKGKGKGKVRETWEGRSSRDVGVRADVCVRERERGRERAREFMRASVYTHMQALMLTQIYSAAGHTRTHKDTHPH